MQEGVKAAKSLARGRISPCQSAERAGGQPRVKESRGFTLCHAAKRALSARCCWQRFMARLHLLSSSASSSTACHTPVLSGGETLQCHHLLCLAASAMSAVAS